jgi:hypothetical protein
MIPHAKSAKTAMVDRCGYALATFRRARLCLRLESAFLTSRSLRPWREATFLAAREDSEG